MIEQRPERADVLLNLIIGVAQRLGMCSDAVQVAGIFQRAHRPIQRRIAAVIPIQQIQRLQQLLLHRFGAVHHMDALFQLSGLIPTQLGGVDLIELFREIIEVFFVELFRQRLLHLFLQAVIRTVCCAHFLQQRVIGAIAVQQAQMVLALQQILVVVLRVDIDEVRSELTQESGSDRTLIDPDAAFAFRVDLPADDQFIFVDVESLLFQDSAGRRALPQREHAFDEGAVRPFLDIARRGPLSAKQADGIDQQ